MVLLGVMLLGMMLPGMLHRLMMHFSIFYYNFVGPGNISVFGCLSPKLILSAPHI